MHRLESTENVAFLIQATLVPTVSEKYTLHLLLKSGKYKDPLEGILIMYILASPTITFQQILWTINFNSIRLFQSLSVGSTLHMRIDIWMVFGWCMYLAQWLLRRKGIEDGLTTGMSNKLFNANPGYSEISCNSSGTLF